MSETYYSNGKLLISGEYLVLDGALALALPTRQGQSLTVSTSDSPGIKWKSIDNQGKTWFEAFINYTDLDTFPEALQPKNTLERILQILTETRKLNPEFLNKGIGLEISTSLDFPQNWGLGSSSTLINNVASWSETDPFELLERTFGGSGYDIACARHNSPILFQIVEGKPRVLEARFENQFTDQLFFVHLNQKQDSRAAIKRYREQSREKQKDLKIKISGITETLLETDNIYGFRALIDAHETLVSEMLQLPTVKSNYFKDYPGSIKSLGAWGGDFVLATGSPEDQDYFRKKGFNTIIPFDEMILN